VGGASPCGIDGSAVAGTGRVLGCGRRSFAGDLRCRHWRLIAGVVVGWRVGLDEVEAGPVESFAGGRDVAVRRDAGGLGGARKVVGPAGAGFELGWADGLADGVEVVAPHVGEHDAGGGVAWEAGVAFDAEGAPVVAAVVVGAQRDEV
jgi:hypothetical protein